MGSLRFLLLMCASSATQPDTETGYSQGGAVGSQDSTVTVCRSSFESNTCKDGAGEHMGGAIFIDGRTDLNITVSQFLGNEVLDPSNLGRFSTGGAIGVVGSKSTLQVAFTLFEDNRAVGGTVSTRGGAVAIEGALSAEFRAGVVFRNNSASGDGAEGVRGGAVSMGSGQLIAVGTFFAGNTAEGNKPCGGAFSADFSENLTRRCLFSALFESNTVLVRRGEGYGGALHLEGGRVAA